MADELTVEGTNALRLKLGLPPLKLKAAPVGEVARAEEKRKSDDEGSDEDDEVEDEDQLVPDAAADGSVLVLDDVNVLDDSRKAKKQRLVEAGTGSRKGEDENEETGKVSAKKVDKRKFAAAIARNEAPITKPDERAEPILGAKLFQSDAIQQNDVEMNKKSKKSSTIIRRKVVQRSTVGALHEDEDDDEQIAQPKVFGAKAIAEDMDDDARELEEMLAKARRANVTVSKDSSITTSFIGKSGEDEYEPFVPASAFARIEKIATSQPDVIPATSKSDDPGPLRIQQQPPPVIPALPTVNPPKVSRRGLAALNAALRAEGDGKRDEIIVGRANDAKPLTDLNKPGDIVTLDYRDDHGRRLTQKEAYRQMMYQFRGEGPGANKQKKREEQLQREQSARSASTGASGGARSGGVTELNKAIKKDHVVLWKN